MMTFRLKRCMRAPEQHSVARNFGECTKKVLDGVICADISEGSC